MAYLIGVLTDLLHTQRDPLALCLLLQSYDQLEPPSLPCCCRLSQFNRYYSLWIPEPAREALVSRGDPLETRPSFPWETPEAPACGPQQPVPQLCSSRVNFLHLIIFLG